MQKLSGCHAAFIQVYFYPNNFKNSFQNTSSFCTSYTINIFDFMYIFIIGIIFFRDSNYSTSTINDSIKAFQFTILKQGNHTLTLSLTTN